MILWFSLLSLTASTQTLQSIPAHKERTNFGARSRLVTNSNLTSLMHRTAARTPTVAARISSRPSLNLCPTIKSSSDRSLLCHCSIQATIQSSNCVLSTLEKPYLDSSAETRIGSWNLKGLSLDFCVSPQFDLHRKGQGVPLLIGFGHSFASSCDFYVVDLMTREMQHRRYDMPGGPFERFKGLAHTRRGWVVWDRIRLWRLAQQMEILVQIDMGRIVAVSTSHMYAMTWDQTMLIRWDLSGDSDMEMHAILPLVGQTYFDHLTQFVTDEQSLYVVQHGRLGTPMAACVSRFVFECGRWTLKPVGVYSCDLARMVIDGTRIMLFEVMPDYEDGYYGLHVHWRTTPTARELAILRIQKTTGKKKTQTRQMEHYIGNELVLYTETKTYWTGGITEEELQKILKIKYTGHPHIMN